MTGELRAGMKITVVTRYTDSVTAIPDGVLSLPPEAGDISLYHGPGSWLLYGYTGGTKQRVKPRSNAYSDLCICNDCIMHAERVTPVRERAIANTNGTGKLVRVTDHWACSWCGRRREHDTRIRHD